MNRPEPTEYAPYYGKYVSLVPDGDIVATLGKQIEETRRMLDGLGEAKGESRYAPGKWTLKETVGHIIDAERIFAYRALRIARNDKQPLAGFEQDDYVANGNHNTCQLAELGEELSIVRRSSIYLFKHLSPEAWLRRGTASEVEVTVRAVAWIIAGHELHHQNLLQKHYL